jgi:hypothetical protein
MGIRTLLSKQNFEDAPEFGVEVLQPALANGHQIYLVSAWAPSYVFSLCRELVKTKEIEPGKLNLVICLPYSPELDEHPAKAFCSYLTEYSNSAKSANQFTKDALALISEGSLSLSALYLPLGITLLSGCIGLIEDKNNKDSATFVDSIAGDHNSPISHQNSWDDSTKDQFEIIELIKNSIFTTPVGVRRLTQDQLVPIFTEIQKKNWFKAFETEKLKPATKKRGRKKKPLISISDEDLEDDFYFGLDDDLDFGGGRFGRDYVESFIDVAQILKGSMSASEYRRYYKDFLSDD